MAGFYSGLLKGMAGKADIERSNVLNEATRAGIANDQQLMDLRQRDQTMQEQQFPLKQQQAELQNTRAMMENQAMEAALKKQEFETNMLKKLATSQTPVDVSQAKGNDLSKLSSQYRDMGSQLLRVDPQKAKSYFDIANQYETQAASQTKNALDIKAKQAEAAGQAVLNVQNQADWEQALPELAANGIQVPQQYWDYNNPETRKFRDMIAFRSPTISKQYKSEIGMLDDIDAQAYDANQKKIKNEELYNKSLAERLSLAGMKQKQTGGRGSMFVRMRADQIMGATEELARSLHIAGTFPVTTSTGLFGEYDGNKTFFGAPMNAAARFATKESEQQFQTTVSNIGQALAIIEAGGYKPNQTQINTYQKKFTFAPGTTIGSRMFTISDAIAQAEARLKNTLANPDVPQEQKSVIEETMKSLTERFPLTPEDIVRSQHNKLSYEEAFKLKQEGKLDRYLELKAKQGGK